MDTAKIRSDAWYATLTEAQLWQAYSVFRRDAWFKVAEYVETEFGIRRPGRNALYSWAAWMRKQESGHRIEEAVAARDEAGELAATVTKDDTLIDAFKSMASMLAMKNNAGEAVKFTKMALALAAAQTKTRELELKAAAQKTKDDALSLSREKFEFSAAKEAIKFADTIKSIVADTSLTDDERINAVRKTLFGALPPE